MKSQTQKHVEALLDWRSPYALDQDLVEYIDAQATMMRERVGRRPDFADTYAEKSGELPSTILVKVDDIKALLTHWRELRANKRLASQEISDRDLSVVSDALQFLMLPFSRFSDSAAKVMGSWGEIGASWLGRAESDATNLTHKANSMTAEHRALCQTLQSICEQEGYATGVKLPADYKLDNSWRR